MATEKILHNSTEPLVLRPPVGSEVYGKPSVNFRQFSHPDSNSVHHNRRRRRLLLLYVLCALVTLAVVAGLLFAMFLLSFGPFASSGSHGFGRQSICRVFSPLLRTSWLERVSADDKMLNVTLSNMPQAQTYWILHLCSEMLTVIRTDERCFIRPMRAELAQACAHGYLKWVHDGHGLPNSVEAKIKDEFWFIDPPTPPKSTPKVIHNSLIMAWCEGVPAFRLVSRPPPSGFLSGESPAEFENAPMPATLPGISTNEYGEDALAKDPDSQEVLDQLLRENTASMADIRQPSAVRERRSIDLASAMGIPASRLPVYPLTPGVTHGSNGQVVRNRRSLDLADQMGISQHQLPIYKNTNGQTHQSVQCLPVRSLIEDASLLADTPSGSVVPVIRDNIYECGP